jgi:hypothetical protein
MKRSLGISIVLACVVCSSDLWAQKLQSTISDGGSVVTDLGYNIKVNKNSSLHRSWVVLNDPGCPVQLNGAGIATAFGNREYSYRQGRDIYCVRANSSS